MNEKRCFCVYMMFLIVSALLMLRLYNISMGENSASQVLAGQYTRRVDIATTKGHVFDRNMRLLDEKKSGHAVFINPSAIADEDISHVADSLSDMTEYPESYFVEKLFSGRPFVITSQNEYKSSYSFCYPLYKRQNGVFLRHILGYYDGDGRGKTGIFGAYDDFLTKDAAGKIYARYEAQASGSAMKNARYELSDEKYSEQNGILLTIDSEMQSVVEKVADEMLDMGAIVVMDVDSHEILASVSRPVYLPDNIKEYLDSDRGEFLNRAFLGYTPGSVFKILIAAAALENAPDSYLREYECKGKIDVFGNVIKCHNTKGHGKLDMKNAFAQSCNPYFIDLALSLRFEEILDMAKAFGIGEFEALGLLGVCEGNLPSSSRETPALVANTAVGQGEILLSPLHVCEMISVAVTGEYSEPCIILGLKNGKTIVQVGS